jgi:hypothetical protein
MKMSRIERCQATECAYNSNGSCHTIAVTIGHPGGCPDCDTFFVSGSKGGDKGATAGVGACRMASCQHNSRLECSAPSISVGPTEDHVHCLTFHEK